MQLKVRKTGGEDFSPVITDKMQFKTIEPSHCAFAPFCYLSENMMIKYSFIVTDSNFGRIDKCNSRAFAETDKIQEKHHRHKNARL